MTKIVETFHAKIDARGRIQVPARFLEAMERQDPDYRSRSFRVTLAAE
jgi:hypothetical protein